MKKNIHVNDLFCDAFNGLQAFSMQIKNSES